MKKKTCTLDNEIKKLNNFLFKDRQDLKIFSYKLGLNEKKTCTLDNEIKKLNNFLLKIGKI